MVVVSVSCGDSMPFCLRPKVTSRTGNPELEHWLRLIGIYHTKAGERQHEVTVKGMEIGMCLHHGDMLVMLGRVQTFYEHCTKPLHTWASESGINSKYTRYRTPDEPGPRRSDRYCRIK